MLNIGSWRAELEARPRAGSSRAGSDKRAAGLAGAYSYAPTPGRADWHLGSGAGAPQPHDDPQTASLPHQQGHTLYAPGGADPETSQDVPWVSTDPAQQESAVLAGLSVLSEDLCANTDAQCVFRPGTSWDVLGRMPANRMFPIWPRHPASSSYAWARRRVTCSDCAGGTPATAPCDVFNEAPWRRVIGPGA